MVGDPTSQPRQTDEPLNGGGRYSVDSEEIISTASSTDVLTATVTDVLDE
jgi:hypothetical protein